MEYKAAYVDLAPRAPGVLYEPTVPGGKSRIAVLVMHSDEDYLNFIGGPELAKRGYRVLCANVAGKEGVLFTQIEKMENVRIAAEYLRALQGVEKIVLLGHSGGATLLTAYQAAAERGRVCLAGPQQLYPFPSEGKPFTPADGVMLLDANWGNAVMGLFSIDPAVTDEESGRDLDPSLNLIDPANGFDANGAAYPTEFIRRYQKAQGERNNRLVDYALERLALIEQGKGRFRDDEPMFIPGSAQGFLNNKLYAQDLHLMSHTRAPHLLLHPDGTATTEIIRSVRGPENPFLLTDDLREGARFLTVRTFLSSYAVRTTPEYGYDADSVYGVDWESCYSSPVSNVKKFSAPLLVMGMTAGWEFAAAETIYDMSASTDKSIAYVEGATHKFNPAKHLEAYPGQYGDTVKTLFDYVDGWLSGDGRF